ncbi:glycoside hydrolase family 125 protein [Gracilibacillus sp. YIM 98692]|uniref:glycoside hydrolase family 125 protein n=1 Tax=Gracilibacillus sp. YIM 98692 TaxID=2663532 RepID=UPI0013D6ACBB|nr:glycoside hydrolase family 125 protein [Gracilibacillus sp. YIM 98692]
MTTHVPKSLNKVIGEVEKYFSSNEKISKLFRNCFLNTYQTTLTGKEDDTTFVVTGDIPAMWLRDSASQVRPYLMVAAEDRQIAKIIKGVIRRQFDYILQDPYANAFNETANGNGHQTDETDMSPIVWERKYEIDSLCYPIQLAYLYWKETNDHSIFDRTFFDVIRMIHKTWKVEQNHNELSSYRFNRKNVRRIDTLPNGGKGAETAWTGMTWSGFRPSDDTCLYGYHIPSNMFAVVVLDYAKEISRQFGELELGKGCEALGKEIKNGIEQYGTINHPLYGRVYVYETDGKGNYVIMDDANVPSLLAAPYLGYCDYKDETYQNTRKLILSRENPYYYEGKIANGIGSPHTPDHYIWHIALSVQGMTSISANERRKILQYLTTTDGGEGYMHEGFHADNPAEYTRSWFAWSNSMFSEFILSLSGKAIKDTPLYRELDKIMKD